jgi:hypothetical protein
MQKIITPRLYMEKTNYFHPSRTATKSQLQKHVKDKCILVLELSFLGLVERMDLLYKFCAIQDAKGN